MYNNSVSIIIPIYNCEEFVANCIEHIQIQSYNQLEIILIDDGSTDKSGDICDKYAEKDKRIKVIHIDNGGVSNARNIGIEHANGTYIQFVDGDDFIKENMTESLVKAMESNESDMVVCGYERVTKYITRKEKFRNKPSVYTKNTYLLSVMSDPRGYYYGVLWNKLFRRDIIMNKSISFNKLLNLGEDFAFCMTYLKHINRIYVLNKRLYMYNCLNEGSLSRYKKENLERCQQELSARDILFEAYKSCFIESRLLVKYKKEVYDYWKTYYLYNMFKVENGFPTFSDADRRVWEETLNNHSEIKICINEISKLNRFAWMTKIQIIKIVSSMKKPLKFLLRKIRSRRGYFK